MESFEDELIDLFIEANIILSDVEFLKTKYGTPQTCWGVQNESCQNQGTWRRRNTGYPEPEQNWVFMCDNCFEQEQEFWNEQWREYYATQG